MKTWTFKNIYIILALERGRHFYMMKKKRPFKKNDRFYYTNMKKIHMAKECHKNVKKQTTVREMFFLFISHKGQFLIAVIFL